MKALGTEKVKKIVTVICTNNAVPHMLSGNAESRAARSHFSTDAALNSLLAVPVLDKPLDLFLQNMQEECIEDAMRAKDLKNLRLRPSRKPPSLRREKTRIKACKRHEQVESLSCSL